MNQSSAEFNKLIGNPYQNTFSMWLCKVITIWSYKHQVVSKHHQLQYLLNSCFKLTKKEILKLCVTGLLWRGSTYGPWAPLIKGYQCGKRSDAIIETEGAAWWLPWSSPVTLKLSFNVPSDDHGSHPDDLFVSVMTSWCTIVISNVQIFHTSSRVLHTSLSQPQLRRRQCCWQSVQRRPLYEICPNLWTL